MSNLGELTVKVHNWRHGVAAKKKAITKTANPLRAGVLSAAAINWTAFFDPVESHPDIILTGVAARSLAKAQAQIEKYGLQNVKAYGSYEEMLSDPNIDVLYTAVPNSLHATWAIKAMEAGKHILIEKPIASTAEDVAKIAACAAKTGKVALEAMHWRNYPVANVTKQRIESGEFGAVTSVHARMILPRTVLAVDDIRFNYSLAGGATMDLVYVLSVTNYFCSSNEETVVEMQKAVPRLNTLDSKIDEAMDLEFTLKNKGKPDIHCTTHADLAQPKLLGIVPKYWDLKPTCTLELERARIHFENFVAPHVAHSVTVSKKDADGKLSGEKEVLQVFKGGPHWGDRGEKWWTSYRYQLEAFVDMVRAAQQQQQQSEGESSKSSCLDDLNISRQVLSVIDAVYDKAELPRRVSSGLESTTL